MRGFQIRMLDAIQDIIENVCSFYPEDLCIMKNS